MSIRQADRLLGGSTPPLAIAHSGIKKKMEVLDMTKKEMRTKLCLNDGVGVEVTDASGTFFYFYENFENSDGISRAYRHFNHGEKLTFYSASWAKQEQFKEYLELYNKIVSLADEAEKAYEQDPENEEAEKLFDETYKRQFDYMMFLCQKLIKWTGCNFDSAKKQINTNNISWLAF